MTIIIPAKGISANKIFLSEMLRKKKVIQVKTTKTNKIFNRQKLSDNHPKSGKTLTQAKGIMNKIMQILKTLKSSNPKIYDISLLRLIGKCK